MKLLPFCRRGVATMATLLTLISLSHAQALDPILTPYDLNADGSLSSEERGKMKADYMRKFDRDNDGSISESERKQAWLHEKVYKEIEANKDEKKPEGEPKEPKTRTRTDLYANELNVIDKKGKTHTTTSTGVREHQTTKTETGREWETHATWENSEGGKLVHTKEGEATKKEDGYTWNSTGITQSKGRKGKSHSLVTDTQGDHTRTDSGYTQSRTTTGRSTKGNWIEESNTERENKPEGGYTEKHITTRYMEEGKTAVTTRTEEVTKVEGGYTKTWNITHTNAEGKTWQVDASADHEVQYSEDGLRWVSKKEWENSKGNSGTIVAEGSKEKSESGESWTVSRKGSNSNGKSWTSKTDGSKTKTDKGHTYQTHTEGEASTGTTWTRDREGKVETEGTHTTGMHKKTTTIDRSETKKSD